MKCWVQIVINYARMALCHPIFFIPLEVTSISKDTPRINEEIRAREVRVVSADNFVRFLASLYSVQVKETAINSSR